MTIRFIDNTTFERIARSPQPERIANYPIYESNNPETPFVPETDETSWWDSNPTWNADGYYLPGPRELTAEERQVVNDINNAAAKNRNVLFEKRNIDKHRYVNMSYSGCDMVPSLSMPGKPPYIFGDIATLSISTHRENFPVRTLGRTNPLGFTKGPRTIAGSLIFNLIDLYPWYSMARELYGYDARSVWDDRTSAGDYPLGDSLPPFDITITLNNEYENTGAVLRIFGVVLIDDGMTLSIDDIVTENTFSFMASGYAPIHRAKGWVATKSA